MKELYKKMQAETLKRYQERYKNEGETPRALGWGCTKDQLERFRITCENNDLEGKTVLDIGCGFADLYGYILKRGIKCRYIGIDIVPEFIEYCKRKYNDAEFINSNIMLEKDRLPSADIVVSVGTLNFKLDYMENLEYTKRFMETAFEKAKERVQLDFLSTNITSDYPKEDFVYYHNPKDVLDLAFKLTDNLKLIHNYKPIPQKEFTLIMYKSCEHMEV